jgi:hypothetical protein
VQRREQRLHDGVVVARRGAGEQVVGQAEALQVLGDDPVVAVGQLAGRDASRSACTWMGVPCSSVPLTISTSRPAIRE